MGLILPLSFRTTNGNFDAFTTRNNLETGSIVRSSKVDIETLGNSQMKLVGENI